MAMTMELSKYGEMFTKAKAILKGMAPVFEATAMIDAATRAPGVGRFSHQELAELIQEVIVPAGEFPLREGWAPNTNSSSSTLLAFVREAIRWDLALDEEIRLMLDTHKVRVDHKTGLLVPIEPSTK